MEEDYVSFDLAKKLKEQGFPQNISFCAYIDECFGSLYESEIEIFCNNDNYISAPTLSLVQKWFCNKWNIHIFPECETDVDSYGNVIGFHYDCTIKNINFSEQTCDTYILENYKTYEEALEVGIRKTLELI